MSRVAVMGAGAWGTAFAMIMADAGNPVTLWARRAAVAEGINSVRRNPDYLSDVPLPAGLTAVTDPQQALADAELVVLAIPAQQLRANLLDWRLPTDSLLISLAKGVENETLLTMSQVVTDIGVDAERVLAVSGPNLAGEIGQRQPAAAVVAARSTGTADRVAAACRTGYFRPYTSVDVVGCEIGGATKNAIALAVGMGQGLGMGANSLASLITRGLAETSRLGEALGADPHTFAGLAGMGDLVATCMSPLSRNRTFGELLGRGHDVAQARALSRGVTEGVRSAASIQALAERHDVDMPIVGHVVDVLAGRQTPRDAIGTMMARQTRPER
ncbi:NAD(P)H-dependent glycerol-3-phosphate dehydrogenase [Enemella evansiae]|uniref:NAD(P)H-dependent glycerol-3-phosphate dehydrogenase n=1 Tax=Enemella evansiae TaxID=2016499 RepID=UPI000B965BB6|nr:NAD(P)H-dependent glycerol-3-phosphate dehydrogenase [Enemella evansiae]OYO05592.1 glycerol-3-phosphate dehydrogenase [Enemella evansiae]